MRLGGAHLEGLAGQGEAVNTADPDLHHISEETAGGGQHQRGERGVASGPTHKHRRRLRPGQLGERALAGRQGGCEASVFTVLVMSLGVRVRCYGVRGQGDKDDMSFSPSLTPSQDRSCSMCSLGDL